MALQKLVSLGTYEEVNGGAHRKAASIVGIPSLVRHLGFWNTGFSAPIGEAKRGRGAEDEAHAVPAPQAESRKSEGLFDPLRASAYLRFIRNLRSVISDGGNAALEPDAPSFAFELDPHVDTGTVTLIRFWWHGMRTTVRLEFHTEYVTLTSIIDISVKKLRGYAAGSTDNYLARIERDIRTLGDLFENCPPKQRSKYKAVTSDLQLWVWDEFEREVLDANIDQIPILDGAFGEVFLDSRGIVTGSKIDSGATQSLPANLELRQTMRPPFQYGLPRKRSRSTIQHDSPGAGWARETLQRIWPLAELEEQLGECEFTVTGFLHGRVLFITALGPQSSQIEGPEAKWTPIRYLLHSYTDDEWQLGRLVDRINTLGTLRLAATMEIGALKVAGGVVERLAEEIELAEDVVQSAIQQSKSGKLGDEADGSTTIGSADKKIQKVNSLRQRINEVVSGDIYHRLERSQYYIERFADESRDLRERRIEGFQTYTEFVTRRMNNIFGYIQFLKTRMESIESSNSSLSRQYSSLKITSVTCGIDGLVSTLNQQNEKMQEQEREIGKIQEFGEIALIGALVPYYVSYSVSHTLALTGLVEEAVWVTITTICSLVVITRIFLKRHDREVWGRLKWILYLFLAYVLLTLIGFAVLRQPWTAAAWEGGDTAIAKSLGNTQNPDHE